MSNNGFLPRFVRGYLASQGVQFGSRSDCNKGMDNLQPCLIIGKSTDSHFTGENGWLDKAFRFFALVFVFALAYYSPAFLCLFLPTEVTENGVRLIVLEGTSPVSFRSLAANYFFSGFDTFWYKAKILSLRLVLLPLSFLGPSFILDYMLHRWKRVRLVNIVSQFFLQPFLIFCFACYIIQVLLYVTFFSVIHKPEPCDSCQTFKPDFTCNDVLPRRILNHLRMQPLVLVKSWSWFTGSLVSYVKLSTIILPSWELSIGCFFRILIFVIFLSLIPVFTVLSFVTILYRALFHILFISSPSAVIQSSSFITASAKINCLLKRLLTFFAFYVFVFSSFGVYVVLVSASYFVMTAIAVAFMLLLYEDSLPFVALVVLVCYYLWSSYSSFTNKYHDLSLTLFGCCKKSQQDQITDEPLTTDPAQETTPTTENKANVVKIPKELFYKACEELMPIKEGVCILLLKVALTLSFVFLAFLLIMQLNVGATPVMKALVTFFTGSFPKIVAMYFDGGRQRRLEALIIEEKAPKIVQDYINGTVTSRASQGQENYGASTDEVILVHDNEENIEMINM